MGPTPVELADAEQVILQWGRALAGLTEAPQSLTGARVVGADVFFRPPTGSVTPTLEICDRTTGGLICLAATKLLGRVS